MKHSIIYGIFAIGCLAESKFPQHDPKDINQSFQRINRESEYSINDIVVRHRELTRFAKENLKTFQNPRYDTSCIRKSLESILPKCLKNNVDSIETNLRAETAAKLSICEFEAAKISYPVECFPKTYYFGNDEDYIDYQECILGLEKSPQWWTTYSGNYRAIGEICFQESLPYEKDEILNLFLNVTEIYDQILKDLNESVEMSSTFKEHSINSFKELQKFMDQVLVKLENDTNESKREFEEKLRQMNSVLEETSVLAKIFSNDTTDMTDIVLNQMQDLSAKWNGFFAQYNSDEFLNEIMSMRELFVNEMESKDLHINDLMDSYTNKLESLYQTSRENNELSKKLYDMLHHSFSHTMKLKDNLANTEMSLMSTSEFVENLLTTFKGLEEMNIGEILSVSEQELLLVFQRITDEFNQNMMKVQDQAKKLDDEIEILVDKIDLATGSLIKINDVLTNNVIMKFFMYLASIFKALSNKFSLMLLGFLAYYFILCYSMRLVSKRFGFLTVLFCSSLCGLLIGDSVVKGIERFNRIEVNSSPIF